MDILFIIPFIICTSQRRNRLYFPLWFASNSISLRRDTHHIPFPRYVLGKAHNPQYYDHCLYWYSYSIMGNGKTKRFKKLNPEKYEKHFKRFPIILPYHKNIETIKWSFTDTTNKHNLQKMAR